MEEDNRHTHKPETELARPAEAVLRGSDVSPAVSEDGSGITGFSF